jgi:hypothetical protein
VISVRVAIHIDPETAQITAVSDPLPQIHEGVLLRTRFVRVALDRPDFALNPTNCDRFAVRTAIGGDEGATAFPSPHFQMANCTDLPFKPKLSLRLSGGTRRAKNPALHAALTARPGEANLARLVVLLPHSAFLDNAHVQSPCRAAEFAADRCPAGSLIGHATAASPLLDEPLAGPVLIRTSVHRLPDMVIALRGQFRIDLVAQVDSVRGRLRARFNSLPDVPVSRVRLTLAGGRTGLLENSEAVCRGAHLARVKLVGQNGRVRKMRVPVSADCHRGD